MQLKGSSSRRCRDLDPGDHVLRIERAVHRAAGELRFVEPKTPRSRRVLLVPEIAMAAFNAHRVRQARERLAAGDSWHDGDLISASSIGTPMEPRNVKRRFNELRTKAGLDWLRLHDLRHACATYLLANGVEPRTVMEILGHSTIRWRWISTAMCCLIGFVLRRPRWTARWRPNEPHWLHSWLQRSPARLHLPGAAGIAAGQVWWRRRDLNPQPPPCKGGALPVELRPRGQVPGYRPDAMPRQRRQDHIVCCGRNGGWGGGQPGNAGGNGGCSVDILGTQKES
jgi:hypothetical protein